MSQDLNSLSLHSGRAVRFTEPYKDSTGARQQKDTKGLEELPSHSAATQSCEEGCSGMALVKAERSRCTFEGGKVSQKPYQY